MPSSTAIETKIQGSFDAVNVHGCLHVVDIDHGAEVSVRADEPVVAASVFKIPVLLELCRRFAAGGLKPDAAMPVPSGYMRTPGETGLSVMLNDVTLSLRDLAYLMMSISDNRATDIVMRLLGKDEINGTMRALGLSGTRLVDDCQGLFNSIADELGADLDEIRWDRLPTRMLEDMRSLSVLTPSKTNRTTPRETTELLTSIWLDRGIAPQASAEIRRILGLQVWPHRLTSGFPDPGVRVSGKTGTVLHVRNEAGIVEFPDGGRFAVAAFLKSSLPNPRNPAVDSAIGAVARTAVDYLRGAVTAE